VKEMAVKDREYAAKAQESKVRGPKEAITWIFGTNVLFAEGTFAD
jgi:hypothetical protein